MKLTTEFPDLDNVRKRFGVPFRPYIPPDIIKEIKTRGKTVESNDIKVATNGTLEYQGQKIILYIRDVKGSIPKYHVVDCRTLRGMRESGNYKRYVVTRRTDGEFILNFADNLLRDTPETHRLDICKNCLWRELNLRSVYAPNAFPLADWFNAVDPGYEPPPKDGLYGPKTSPITDPYSNYPPEWNLLSFQCRERANWKCEKCDIDLKADRRYLHAHHLRGTNHNDPEDLKALCIGCHAEQPFHNMTGLQDYKDFIEKYGNLWKQLTRG